MNKKQEHRKRFNEILSGVKLRLHTNRNMYDIAKEQFRLEREADKLLLGNNKVTKKRR